MKKLLFHFPAIAALILCAADVTPVSQAAEPVRWVKLTFALDGKAATWDGRVSAVGAEVRDLQAWGFEAHHKLDKIARSWTCDSGLPSADQWKQSGNSFAEPYRGVLVAVEGGVETRLQMTTAQGDFEVDLSALKPGRPLRFLDGRVSAEWCAQGAQLVAETRSEDDFPSVACDPAGQCWVAWLGYDDQQKVDHLYVRDLGASSTVWEPVPPGDYHDPLLVFDGQEELWAVWSAQEKGNWDLYALPISRSGGGSGETPMSPMRLTTAPGSDLHPAVSRSLDGSVWLVWQSFRRGNADIYAKVLRNGAWTEDFRVTSTPANDWEPSISCDTGGKAWIAWDTYRHGNYDIYLQAVWLEADGTLGRGPQVPVAVSADFEAHANVLAGPDGRIWIAYDAAGPNWGKDFRQGSPTSEGAYAEPLHATRRVELRCWRGGKLYRPSRALPQKLSALRPASILHGTRGDVIRFYEKPQLALDGQDRLWIIFRLNRQGYAGHPRQGGIWEVFATCGTEQGWLEPILLPLSGGRQNQPTGIARNQEGELELAWSSGNHFVNERYVVRTGRLPRLDQQTASASRIRLSPVPLPKAPATAPTGHQVPTIEVGGKKYYVFFGDLHRHTDISLCTPTIDGCLDDLFRYAIDAAELDFIAVTDHTRDTDPYPWWRTQKAVDMYNLPDRFVPIYAYERSNAGPGGGHRNVFLLERGRDVNYGDAYFSGSGLPRPDTNPDTTLYTWLKQQGAAFTIAHTPAYSTAQQRGTWSYNDPEVEPVAEIFQAYRVSYEQPSGQSPDNRSLWHALSKGFKLGFIASSDHHSTHMSYACVLAEGPTRADLFDAIKQRRTYAAMDKIILDVRMGESPIGSILNDLQTPTLQVAVTGTAPIERIDIVRDGQFVYTLEEKPTEYLFDYADNNPPSESGYYYVRVKQADGAVAWGSPIWVQR